MNNFKGKAAVITGAASGIGRAIAIKAADEGMNLGLIDMNASELEILSEQLKQKGVDVLYRPVDVTDSIAMEDFAQSCFERFDEIDLLVNNAGILRVGGCWDQSADDWQKMMSINIMGVVNGINAFVPRIIDNGNAAHIVNTGSVGSLVAAPNMAQYTTCKMAVRGLTECLYLELKMQQKPIGVSLLCPGPVSTNIANSLIGGFLGDDASPEKIAEIKAATEAMDPNFISPDAVAEKVFDAIRSESFWIFTHPLKKHLHGLTQAVVNGENPEYSEVKFD